MDTYQRMQPHPRLRSHKKEIKYSLYPEFASSTARTSLGYRNLNPQQIVISRRDQFTVFISPVNPELTTTCTHHYTLDLLDSLSYIVLGIYAPSTSGNYQRQFWFVNPIAKYCVIHIQIYLYLIFF